MKYLHNQLFDKQKVPSASSTANYAGAWLLLPALFFETGFFTWILMAVIAGIVMIFILIAFILRPMTRQTEEQKRPETEPELTPDEESAKPADLSVPEDVDGATTLPSLPRTPESEISTVVTPIMTPVAEPDTVPVSGQRPADIGWQIAGITDVGLRRELNEDNLLMIEAEQDGLGPYGLYIVADGLGGHEAGEVASQLTIETIQSQMNNPPSATDAPFKEWFKATISVANNAVLEYQGSHKEAQKMGSTLIMALVVGENAYVTNVGDSRAYHLTDQAINQISVDHSLVERLVQIGQITREEARTHKQRNVVYSIIGEKRRLEIGYYQQALAPGDRLLLCSDGLSGMITDEEILEISRNESNLAKAGRLLVKAAKEAGGHDNITAILVEMDGETRLD